MKQARPSTTPKNVTQSQPNAFRFLYQLLVLIGMWIMLMMPIINIINIGLEGYLIGHEQTFNLEFEENDVVTNATAYYTIQPENKLVPLDESTFIHTVPSADGVKQGYGFPPTNFGDAITRIYTKEYKPPVNSKCTTTVQTRMMLLVANYGYLSGTVQCGTLPTKEYFIHAARLLPKIAFGDDGIMAKFVGMDVLDFLTTPAVTNMSLYENGKSQLDGFIVIDLDKFDAFATSDPECSEKPGYFGSKKTFCPSRLKSSEGVFFSTWNHEILTDLEFPHTLRSFHKVNTFFFGLVYSSDSCAAGRSIGILPSRPGGLIDRPRLHVGCEELYAEHWILLVIQLVLSVYILVITTAQIWALIRATQYFFENKVLANIDFASALLNNKWVLGFMVIIQSREIALMHTICIAVAVNGFMPVLFMFVLCHALPLYVMGGILHLFLPNLRKSAPAWFVKFRIYALWVVLVYGICFCVWIAQKSESIRNLYLGGYPVVQPLLLQDGSSNLSMDKLRNIGMYQKWTSLGVYNMASSPGSGIPELLLTFVGVGLLGSITYVSAEKRKLAKQRVYIGPRSTDSDIGSKKSKRVDAYKDVLAARGVISGAGVFGNGDSDITELRGLRYITINCQVNDGIYIFRRLMVGSWAVVQLLFWKSGFTSQNVIAVLDKDKGLRSETTDDNSSSRVVDDAVNEVVTAATVSPELTHVHL